ncbi:MAG: glucokinase [Phycisphaerae bacterium]
MLVVGDIGATNIRLATFKRGRPRDFSQPRKYSRKPDGSPWTVVEALADFARSLPEPVEAACLGVAGRVQEEELVIPSNRKDIIRRAEVAASLGIEPRRVRLVNDMLPHIACVDLLREDETIFIRQGKREAATRAVSMPGTGLGTGLAVYDETIGRHRHNPVPSEGGHVEFAPRTDEQIEVLRACRGMLPPWENQVTWETILCGEGLRRVYTLFTGGSAKDLPAAPPAEAITAEAAPGVDAAAREHTLDFFVAVWGQQCANLMLASAAAGGLYVGGSIASSLLPRLCTDRFLEPMSATGSDALLELTAGVAVVFMRHPETGLLGSAALAERLL